VGGIDVVIDYASQSANPGRAFFRTSNDASGVTPGGFLFVNVPLGEIHLTSVAPEFGGIIDLRTSITTNAQVRDLGDVRYDEDLPFVAQVTPRDGTIGVPIATSVELLFNEALATNSIQASGIYIRSSTGKVASAGRTVARYERAFAVSCA
jgi:hypothetical protein